MAPASVGVIGGGVAGLMCATRLQELGLAPIVFDTGKHAVGGRASSRRLWSSAPVHSRRYAASVAYVIRSSAASRLSSQGAERAPFSAAAR